MGPGGLEAHRVARPRVPRPAYHPPTASTERLRMTTGKLREPASPPDGARRGASGATCRCRVGKFGGGDRPKNLLAPISKPRITVPPVWTRPCTEDIGGIQMTIEGGEGPRREREDEFVDRPTSRSTHSTRVRELEQQRRVPRRGATSRLTGAVTRTRTPSTHTEGRHPQHRRRRCTQPGAEGHRKPVSGCHQTRPGDAR